MYQIDLGLNSNFNSRQNKLIDYEFKINYQKINKNEKMCKKLK